MKVHVYDTHVKTMTGNYYHFDVLVDDAHKQQVLTFAKQYLQSIGVESANVRSQRCNFCHSETGREEVQECIVNTGYYIVPMQGCPVIEPS